MMTDDELAAGIWREDMRRGARVSEGLGECIVELPVLLAPLIDKVTPVLACTVVAELLKTEADWVPEDGSPSDDVRAVAAGIGARWEGTSWTRALASSRARSDACWEPADTVLPLVAVARAADLAEKMAAVSLACIWRKCSILGRRIDVEVAEAAEVAGIVDATAAEEEMTDIVVPGMDERLVPVVVVEAAFSREGGGACTKAERNVWSGSLGSVVARVAAADS